MRSPNLLAIAALCAGAILAGCAGQHSHPWPDSDQAPGVYKTDARNDGKGVGSVVVTSSAGGGWDVSTETGIVGHVPARNVKSPDSTGDHVLELTSVDGYRYVLYVDGVGHELRRPGA